MNGRDLPIIVTPVPGPASRSWVDRLVRHECPAITARRARRASAIGAADTDPIVWDQALGANVLAAYVKLRYDDWNAYSRHLTEWERDTTLDC